MCEGEPMPNAAIRVLRRRPQRLGAPAPKRFHSTEPPDFERRQR